MANKNKSIELKAIFGNLKIDGVAQVSKVPDNARQIHRVDNCLIFSNNKFIFFKGYGEDGKIYKIEWTYKLEMDILNTL